MHDEFNQLLTNVVHAPLQRFIDQSASAVSELEFTLGEPLPEDTMKTWNAALDGITAHYVEMLSGLTS